VVLLGLWFAWRSAQPSDPDPVAPDAPVPAVDAPEAERSASPDAPVEPEVPVDAPAVDAPAAPVLPPADGSVRCPIQLDAPFEGPVEYVEVLQLEGGGIQPQPVDARIEDGVLIADADFANAGWVEVPGYPTLQWRADQSACPALSLASTSAVMGTVSPPDGDVSVSACGSTLPADDDGAFYVPAVPGPCRVYATRSDGAVLVQGERTQVTVVEGQDVVVDLWVPDETWGSIGLWLTKDDPVRVAAVVGGSAAEMAHVQPGDVVLSIDGETAHGCDQGWLSSCFHGPIGTVVVVEIQDRGAVVLERLWTESME
jgi:hypothetical protein